ncbi:peroxiredoxin, partial [Staphylococcus arlettae]
MLQKGDQFPQFELENQDGELVSNETLKGSKAI